MKTLSQTSPVGYVDVQELIEIDRKLIVHNDDYNTFDWVIETLVNVCKHSQEQAEQCAMIIHTKGKYAVKHGHFKLLKPMKEAISERGIDVTIE